MQIEYRELSTDKDFEQCIDIQRSVFGFSEKDLVSPLLFKLIARNHPPMGFGMGIFRKGETQEEIIGFILGFATYLESSVYVVLLAIKKEYQNGVFGFKLLFHYRELLLSKGITNLLGVYEPLECNLGRLYCHSFGYLGTKYLPDISNNLSDKLYVVWELNSLHTLNRLQRKDRTNPEEAIKNYPIVTHDFNLNNERILVEIPDNFIALKQADYVTAHEWRIKTRAIFNEYLNVRKYIIKDCIFIKKENSKRFFYVLEKFFLNE